MEFTVNRIGYGAMRIAGTGAFDDGTPRDRDGAIAVLRRAVELGVNHIDTALIYYSDPARLAGIAAGPRRGSRPAGVVHLDLAPRRHR